MENKNKTFPILQTGRQIPWSIAEEAYEVYSKKYGTSQSLERLAERGGFASEELDKFVPGWREKISEINQLKEENEKLKAEIVLYISQLKELSSKTLSENKLEKEEQQTLDLNCCNVHGDCKKADEDALKNGKKIYHCYDDCCEDCFGY